MNCKTTQEQFWAGEFGDSYSIRNAASSHLVATAVQAFSCMLHRVGPVNSFIEFGCNVGRNLRALRILKPDARLAGVEINEKAVKELADIPNLEIFHQSILELQVAGQYDVAFTFGVLIHIAPEMLPTVYENLYQSSGKYILIAEYYNPTPMEMSYRGVSGKLLESTEF